MWRFPAFGERTSAPEHLFLKPTTSTKLFLKTPRAFQKTFSSFCTFMPKFHENTLNLSSRIQIYIYTSTQKRAKVVYTHTRARAHTHKLNKLPFSLSRLPLYKHLYAERLQQQTLSIAWLILAFLTCISDYSCVEEIIMRNIIRK